MTHLTIKKDPYDVHWRKKGSYGETRITRMIKRKRARHERQVLSKSWKPRWMNGRLMQPCDMGGFCDYPCNGDC